MLCITWPGGCPNKAAWTNCASFWLITGNCSRRAGSPPTASISWRCCTSGRISAARTPGEP